MTQSAESSRKGERSRTQHLSDLLAALHPDELGLACRWLSKWTGLGELDCQEYVRRCQAGCNWSRHQVRNDTFRDIGYVAMRMADLHAVIIDEFMAFLDELRVTVTERRLVVPKTGLAKCRKR